MSRYAGLLRGVNLGNVRVAMADLRQIGQDAGFTAVSTHLNSGNLLFTADTGDAAEHAATLTAALEKHLGRPIPVLVRTPAELVAALDGASAAFPHAAQERVAIAFLSASARSGDPRRLGEWSSEEYLIDGAQVYLHYPDGQAGTKLMNTFIEKKLSVLATVRGIKTVAGIIGKL